MLTEQFVVFGVLPCIKKMLLALSVRRDKEKKKDDFTDSYLMMELWLKATELLCQLINWLFIHIIGIVLHFILSNFSFLICIPWVLSLIIPVAVTHYPVIVLFQSDQFNMSDSSCVMSGSCLPITGTGPWHPGAEFREWASLCWQSLRLCLSGCCHSFWQYQRLLATT